MNLMPLVRPALLKCRILPDADDNARTSSSLTNRSSSERAERMVNSRRFMPMLSPGPHHIRDNVRV